MSASKPLFTVTQCYCPRRMSLSLSSSHKSLNPTLPKSKTYFANCSASLIAKLKLDRVDLYVQLVHSLLDELMAIEVAK